MYTCLKPFVEVSSRRSVEQTPVTQQRKKYILDICGGIDKI
jgi:hypothetical protein